MKKTDKYKRLIFTILSLFCTAFIFAQSLMPADKSSDESGFVLNFLNSITEFLGVGQPFTSYIVRKTAHFFEFVVLCVLLFVTYRFYINRLFWVSVATAASYVFVAVTDECIQLFSDGRACQFTDVIIDSAGGTFALVIMMIINYTLIKHKKT